MRLKVDKNLGLSSYFLYRYGFNEDISISDKYPNHIEDITIERTKVKNSNDLEIALKNKMDEATADGKAALALSGGIDSAILAKFMPEGSIAYTFRCIVPGVKVTDESPRAAHHAKYCNLEHRIIDITWEDIEETDIIYGGLDGLLQKDWLFNEFVDRYSYIKPYYVLRNPQLPLEPFYEFEKDGHIDPHDFINKYLRQEALGSYNNACDTAGIRFVAPYSETVMDCPIDYSRIRSGDTKYLVREIFNPRPVNEWFSDWKGPTRSEFIPHCTDNMSGDQKWMVWCAEKYLDLLDEMEK